MRSMSAEMLVKCLAQMQLESGSLRDSIEALAAATAVQDLIVL